MKIFTNKKYRDLVNSHIEEVTILMEGKVNAEIQAGRLIEKCENLELTIKTLLAENKSLERQYSGCKGGFGKKINRLNKEIESLKSQIKELEEKLAESMTDKYLRKKLPSDRSKSKLKMKIKDCTKISNIARKAYGRQEAD